MASKIRLYEKFEILELFTQSELNFKGIVKSTRMDFTIFESRSHRL